MEWISIDDVKFLLSLCPNEEIVPTGLDSTFYITLSAEADQKIADRLSEIRAKINR